MVGSEEVGWSEAGGFPPIDFSGCSVRALTDTTFVMLVITLRFQSIAW